MSTHNSSIYVKKKLSSNIGKRVSRIIFDFYFEANRDTIT